MSAECDRCGTDLCYAEEGMVCRVCAAEDKVGRLLKLALAISQSGAPVDYNHADGECAWCGGPVVGWMELKNEPVLNHEHFCPWLKVEAVAKEEGWTE